jgi:chromosome segregation protein
MTLESKYNYLLNLEKENEGYYKSVKSALEYAKTSNIKNVYGTVASLISTDEKYEYAIEIALGGYLQNVVVENENEAKQIISYLKENTLGRVTFLPISSIKKVSFDVKGKISKLKGYVGMATELVKFDKKYADAINLSLGGIAIVDNIDNAVEISKSLKNSVKIVTLAGELISSTGSITGGQVAHKSAGLIGRIEKIAELKNQIKEEQEKCDNLTAQISKIFEESNVVVKELETLKEKQDELKIEVATFSEKYENIKIELEKLESTKATNMKAIEELKDQNHELQLKLVENDEEVSRITIQIEKSQNIIDEYTRFNKEKQQAIDFLNEDVVNLKISLSSFDESVSSIDEMKEKFELDIQNFELAISKKKEQIENLNKSIEDNNVQIESIKEKINSQVKFKEEYTDITEKLKSEKDSLTKKQEEIEVDMTKTFRKIESLKEEKAKVEAKKVKFDIDIENLKNKMWDDYELTVSSSKKLVETLPESEISENEIKNKAEKIRKQIKDLGEVSISAIEEYNNTKERYDFISTQKIDLEETKTKLEGLINNMTVIMKQQFTKQFKIITENFNETFKELFGGGKADLKLSDENDVLASGIEIEVQPPGKKLQSMSLLSGGERALTATALLFAILKIKSPPFCILDEIEAALDDVNVHRFAEYIKKYSKNTQFIVITHRKGTMEVASSVYGVTMQEYGISKIISMKLK